MYAPDTKLLCMHGLHQQCTFQGAQTPNANLPKSCLAAPVPPLLPTRPPCPVRLQLSGRLWLTTVTWSSSWHMPSWV